VTKDQLEVLKKAALQVLLPAQPEPVRWVGQDAFPPLYQYHHQEGLINRPEEKGHSKHAISLQPALWQVTK